MAGASVRHRWIQAVRRSDLHPSARLIAFVFVEYVHASDPRAERVWVGHDALCSDTGLSTNTTAKYRDLLISLGWLVETEARRGVRPARYALRIPGPSLSMVETLGEAETGSLGSQRLRLNGLRQGLISEGLGSQSTGSRVSMVEAKPLQNRKEPESKPGFVRTSPARAAAENLRDEYSDDDPWIRQQETEPPPHVAAQFRAVQFVAAGIAEPEPSLAVCSHGVMLGLKLGGGVLACCPIPDGEP